MDPSLLFLDGNMEHYLSSILYASTLHKGWSVQALLDQSAHNTIIQAHCDFIKNGANVISTFNSAVLPFFLKFEGLESQLYKLHETSARLARKAIEQSSSKCKLAGILPAPSRSFQEWTIMIDSDFKSIYGEITRALVKEVDFLIAEDLKQLREAYLIASVVQSEAPHTPLYLNFNLKSATQIKNGDNLEQVIKALEYYLEQPVAGYGLSGRAEDVLQAAKVLKTEKQLLLYLGLHEEQELGFKKELLPERVKMVGIFQKSNPVLLEKLRASF